MQDSVVSVVASQGKVGDAKHSEDFEWQINYERKVAQQMTDMLEKKVSSLLAQIDRLESEAEDEFKKKVNFNSEIEELQKVIKSLDN